MNGAVISDSAPGATAYKLCPRCHHIYAANLQFCARDRSELVPDERILAGKFLLLRKIGEGNMGAVYEAEQPQIGRTVAVKVLRADPQVMLRFEREVQASGAINHANVVTIYDSGMTDDGAGYIAMEYLEGQSLAQYLEQTRVVPPAKAMELWVQAVRAISAAHNKGIVHRDIKPDNIFLSRQHNDGDTTTVVKVLDFGIAKFSKRPQPAKGTAPGIIIGTMQYMSPEQLQGAEADPRGDIYALGLILVEMLTGRFPWGSDKEQAYTLYALRMVQPPAALQSLRPEQPFSPELCRLVDDLLAQDMSRRPANGGELMQRLKQVPEASAIVRPDARGSSDAIPTARAPAPGGSWSGTQMVDRAVLPLPRRLSALFSRRLALIGLLLVAGVLGGGLMLLLLGSKSGSGPNVKVDMAPPQPIKEDKVLAATPGEKDADIAPTGPNTKTGPHRVVRGPGNLQVHFAFTDAKGVQLVCGGRKLPAPDCSAGGLCKSVVAVAAGQKCIVEKDKLKKVFSYADLQKNPADRKNLIHVLVRFP